MIRSRIKPERQDHTLSFQIDEPLLLRPTVSSSGRDSAFVNPSHYQLPPGATASVPHVSVTHSRPNADQADAYGGIMYEPVMQAQAASTTSLLATAAIRRAKSTTRLTDTQMESIQALLNQNIPLGVIANLMETMMNAPEASTGNSSTGPEVPNPSEMIGPPMYESQ
jgi:hypothetical protein